MGTGRVLGEAASLGLSAIEAEPEGFLPSDPADALRVLGEHDLSLVGDSCRSCCTAPNDAGASSPLRERVLTIKAARCDSLLPELSTHT